MTTPSPSIRLLPPAAAQSASATVTELINTAYAANGGGLWSIPDKKRTTLPEITSLISASEILAAYSADMDIVGCVHWHRMDADTAGLGMLAVGHQVQGRGVGRMLVEAAEKQAREMGCGRMQLELLLPKEWKHQGKEMLAKWYDRMGYRRVRVGKLKAFEPEMEKLLACPCDHVVYHKSLA